MLVHGWLFVGVVAICATAVAVSTKTQAAAAYPNSDGIAIMSGVVGFIAWGMWTYGTLDVEVVTDSGATVSMGMPSLAIFGIAMAMIPGFIALTGPADIIARARDPSSREV